MTGRKVLGLLGPLLKDRHFYLGGGTALALTLGHRKSKDFGWFRSHSFKDPLRLGKELQEKGVPFRIQQIDRGPWKEPCPEYG